MVMVIGCTAEGGCPSEWMVASLMVVMVMMMVMAIIFFCGLAARGFPREQWLSRLAPM